MHLPLRSMIRYYSVNACFMKNEFTDIPKVHLTFPFKVSLHPLAKKIGPISEQWCHKFGLFENEKYLKIYQDSNYGQMVARMYPSVPNDRIDVVVDYFSFNFLLDDLLEDAGIYGPDFRLAEKYIHKLKNIMNSPKIPTVESPFEKAYLNIWQRLADLTSPTLRNRFGQHILGYLQAMVYENKTREKMRAPSFPKYFAARVYAGFCLPVVDLIQIGSGIDLPDHIANNDVFKQMTLVFGNLLCFSNDFFSWRKEAENNDFHNLVAVIKQGENLTWQNAVLQAKEIYEFQTQLFLELEKLLPKFEPEYEEDVRRTVDGLKAAVVGYLEFMQNDKCIRYQEVNF